jgi:hypothetical protein
LLVLVLAIATPLAAPNESTVYVGGLFGVSTLSADSHSIVTPQTSQASHYKPENGPALSGLVGVHLHGFVSLQANYVWNRNSLTSLSTVTSPTGGAFAEQDRASDQHALILDLLVFMRGRDSRVRPYFSTGAGIFRFASGRPSRTAGTGPYLSLDPVTSTHAGFRVAVGIDFAIGASWDFRYTYGDTITPNPISQRLEPSGRRRLANFQSLFGLIRRL